MSGMNGITISSSKTGDCNRNTKESNTDELPIMKACYPLLFLMKLFGLFHTENDHQNDTKGRRMNFSKCYSLLVIGLLFVNSCRMLAIFTGNEKYGLDLFSKIIEVAWYWLAMSNAIICFPINKHLIKFMKEHAKLNENTKDILELSKSNVVHFRKMVVKVLVFSLFCLALDNGTVGWALFQTDYKKTRMVPYSNDFSFWPDLALKIGFLVVYLFTSAAWMFPMALFVVLCRILTAAFNNVNNQIQHLIEKWNEVEDKSDMCKELEKLRRWHQHVCRLVLLGDQCTSAHIAVSFCVNLVNSMLLVYSIMYDIDEISKGGLAVISIMVFWSVTSLGALGLELTTGALVNSAAHAKLESIYDLHIDNMNPQTQTQLMLLVSRLTGSPIGLTAWGMFIIDKHTIITTVGVFISYFVLLIESRPDNGDKMDISQALAQNISMLLNATI